MSLKRKSAISVLACALLAGVVGMALTFSAFTSTTENTANTFASGTVVLGDNDLNVALLEMSEMQPGSTATKCLTVEYTGSLDSTVRLYGETTSTPLKDLSPFIDVVVTRGTFPGAAPALNACDGFVADTADHKALGAGILFKDLLSAYPADYAAAIVDPDDTWETNEKAVYQVEVTLKSDDDAQAKDAATTLKFEAQDKGPVVAP
jgi:hypothetical protein